MKHMAYEFFAGGGMARTGLGTGWDVGFANDFEEKKARAYRANHDAAINVDDVANLTLADLPGCPDMVWASFPCQDLSLAGKGAGLSGNRSGAFWSFWKLIDALRDDGRQPPIVVLENVTGLLTSKSGADFSALVEAVCESGFRVGAVVINALEFVPQSRPRLFILAVADDCALPAGCHRAYPDATWTSASLDLAVARLSPLAQGRWFWPSLPSPCGTPQSLVEIVEQDRGNLRWDDASQTLHYLSLMSPLHRAKVDAARSSRSLQVGAMYRRTRAGAGGVREQRFEVRFDGIAGCLRTPGGGSSRQRLLFVENGFIRSRLVSAREAARLMGLPETYVLPENYNEAYHLLGDGVVAPVVRHLAHHFIEPLLLANGHVKKAA